MNKKYNIESDKLSGNAVVRSKVCLSSFIVFSIALSSYVVQAADIVPSPDQQTNVGTSSNGIPVLNISAPTNAGVSHNKFQEFNVGEQGLIVNNLNLQNYNPNYASTLSGAHVEFNYNFGTGDAARVILNEVVSNSTSQLKGSTEIYGRRADYIVANPNGITCAGCGFINTGRLSLITGSSDIQNGDIAGFNVSATGVLQINGVGATAFGMYAPTNADLVSNVVRIAGNVTSGGDLSIYSGNGWFDYKNKNISSDDNSSAEIAVDVSAVGGMKANNIRIIATQKGFGINTSGNLIADMGNVEITADGDIVMKNAAATVDVNIKSGSGSAKFNDGDIYAKNIKIDVANELINNKSNVIVAQESLNITAGNNLINIGKLHSAQDISIRSTDLDNYGQILGRNLSFSLGNDLINHRAAGILAGGDINFNVGRDLVNYKAEIYAGGSINVFGRSDLTFVPSGLEITPANMKDLAQLYDNPYIDAEVIETITPPVVVFPDEGTTPDELADLQLKLEDGSFVEVPADVLEILNNAGDSYTLPNGYTIILGQELVTEIENPEYAACEETGSCDDVPPTIQKYSYVGIDDLTLKGPDNTNLFYEIVEAIDDDSGISDDVETNPDVALGQIPVQDNGGSFTSNALDKNKSNMDDYVFSSNLMGTLLNWAGRIESGRNIEINAASIMNKGYDINTGASAGRIDTVQKHGKGFSRTPHIMWYNTLTDTYLDSMPAQIIAGSDMTLNGNAILNVSGVLSSRGNMILNAKSSIKNQTYSDVLRLTTKWESRKWQGLKGWRYSSYYTYEDKRIYSKQRSTILSGAELKLKSNLLINDQELAPLGTIGGNTPEELANGISVSTRLPIGDNGIFVVNPNEKYLVQTNVSFMNPNDFIGSDYFFTGLGDAKTALDTTRIIGDPAYENRLIMDAIVNATGRHYLDNNGIIGSDADQMRALYDAAIDASRDMNLTVGVALTAAQIANLQQDIIWYVEKEIDGHTVLVPQLYLSQATLNSLDGSPTSKITGVSVIGENDYVVNVGTIAADDLLSLNLGNGALDNLGGTIKTTGKNSNLTIAAGTINNQTQTNQIGYTVGSLIKHTETHIGDTATIGSGGNLNIITSGDINIAGGKVYAGGNADLNIGGDLNVGAVQDYTYDYKKSKSGWGLDSKSNTTINESFKNVGSTIETGSDLSVKISGDSTFAGAMVSSGGNAALDIGGNANMLAIVDYDYNYNKTDKKSWGGLVREKDTIEDSATKLHVSDIFVNDGLVLNAGNNLNMVASNINVGSNAAISVGNNINVLSGEEVSSHYEIHEKTEYLKGVGVSADCSDGHCSANVTIGQQNKDENYIENHTAVGSVINVGGDLNMGGNNDITIQGGNITVGGDGDIKAGNDINILEAQNTIKTGISHEDVKISAGVAVGNAYVDAGYATAAMVEATDAVVKATENLKYIKDLYDQGKASAESVRDAEANLAMATANAVSAELGMVSSIAGAASAAGTSFGTGLYGSAGVNYETNKKSDLTNTSESVNSNILGNNLTFSSGNNLTQIGSNVGANDTLVYDIKNDLNILAGTDTYQSESKSEQIIAGMSVGNNAVQVNAGYNESSNRTSSTTNVNSNVTADKIVINTGDNATFAGANVDASGDLTIHIGGDLTIESKQNTDYAKGDNWGMSFGLGTGGAKVGFNSGKSDHDSTWVNDVTELIGGNVDIVVDGKTTVTGAVIASDDGGELNLTTNELAYNDIQDFNKNYENGFGLNTNIGISTDKGQTSLHPQGSTTVRMKDKGSTTEQTTHATIGAGNITVGGDTNSALVGLNRDVDNSQEITKNQITDALDGGVLVDNRVFSESGIEQIKDQHENLVDNAIIAGVGAYGTIAGTTDVVKDVITGETSVTDAAGSWKANQSGMATGVRRGGSDEAQSIIQKIDTGTATPEELKRLAEINSGGKANLIYGKDGEIIGFSDEYGTVYRSGANDLDNKQGYINVANGAATDSYIFLGTDAEERAHNYVGANEELAKSAANNEISYYNTVANWTGGYSVAPGQSSGGLGTQQQKQWNQNYNIGTNQTLLENTNKYDNVINKADSGVVILAGSAGTNLLLASSPKPIVSPAAARAAASASAASALAAKYSDLGTKLNHIFGKAEHGLNVLLTKFGGNQVAAFDAIDKAAQQIITKSNITNEVIRKLPVVVEGVPLEVRGRVIDGVFKIGTAYVPPL